MLLKNVHLQSLRAYVFMNISIFCRILTFVLWRGLNIFSQDIITWGMVIVIVEFSFETFLSYSKIQKVYRETLSPSLLHPYFPQSRKLHSVILCGNSSWSSESLFVSYIVVCSQVLNQKDSRVILVPIFYAFNASIMSWLHVHCVALRKKATIATITSQRVRLQYWTKLVQRIHLFSVNSALFLMEELLLPRKRSPFAVSTL